MWNLWPGWEGFPPSSVGLFLRRPPLPAFCQPDWWAGRGVLDPQAGPNDFGPANIGQLKHVATMARDEFEARLPGGAGAAIDALVGGWYDPQTGQPLVPNPPDQNLAPINLGQLKAVAKPFYDRLIDLGLLPAGAYPWTATATDDANYAPANIGQLKNVFNIDVVGLVAAATLDPDADFDGDGITNGEELAGPNPTDPLLWDSDGDGVGDGDEKTANTDPNDAQSLPSLEPPFIRYSAVGLDYEDTLVGFDENEDPIWGGNLILWDDSDVWFELLSHTLGAAELNGMMPENAASPNAPHLRERPLGYAYVESESVRTEPHIEHEWFLAFAYARREWLVVDVARDHEIRRSFLKVTEKSDDGASPEIVGVEAVELVIPARSYHSDPIDYAAEIVEPPGEWAKVTVSLIPVDLSVDANRNGEVEIGIDQTSAETPYRFWINNDDDSEEDEEDYGEGSQPDHVDGIIPTQRDLEDFARIQLLVGGLHEQLKSGEVQVTMKFKEGTVEGNPALNLWLHLDEDGGRDYLLDEQIAARHLELINPGSVTASSGYTFQPSFWSGEGIPNYHAIASENPHRYLLFEGASKGKGELVLEFKKWNEVLGESCSCWINLLDVRNMYQRAKVTPDHPDEFTEPNDFVGDPFNPTITPPVPEIGWTWDPNGKDFIEDPEEERQYLVFVHGWRMTYHGSQKYAESMFKRLWQTGYKGRFAFVRWPTYSEDTHPLNNGFFTYNISDYRAWLSGKGVAAFVNSLPSSHVRNITAHSMGNVVVSSALLEGMQVDNYALLNAAIPAMCYDGNNALYEFDREAPDGDADPITNALGFKEKVVQTDGARLINFYLSNDSALSDENFGWVANNRNYKPESFNLGTTGYDYDPNRAAGTKVYLTFATEFGRNLRSFPESAAYATASRTYAVGADGRTAGVINDKLDMDAQYGFGDTHNAEWAWRIQKTHRFYHDLMEKLNLEPIPQ